MPFTYIKSLFDILPQYDLFFVDLWGVLHDGVAPFPNTLNFLEGVLKLNKKVVLLSNSPRPASYTAQRLQEMGITPQYYTEIVTSGTQCLNHLNNRENHFYSNLGKYVYYYGPARERGLIDSLISYVEVETLQKANFILMTSTLNWEDTVESIIPFLKEALKLNLPLICANADFEIMRENQKFICAGAYANAYKQMGGTTVVYGKPDPSLYTLARKNFKNIPNDKIVMIGDSLRTDIKGANQYNIDSTLILKSGILNYLLETPMHQEQKLEELCKLYKAKPTYIL